MEEKIIAEETEVLENTIPEELKKYLEADENTLSEIENVLTELDNKMESLNNEKEESEKNFENRLEEFKQMIAKEKEDAFNEFSKKEEELNQEKTRIENIKLDEQAKQVNYIDSLKSTLSLYNSKITSIEDAIKACEDNETLSKALEEEKEKLNSELSKEYDLRKEVLDSVLKDIGVNVIEEKNNIDLNQEINLDFRTPEETKLKTEAEPIKIEEPQVNANLDIINNEVEEIDTEVISHEPREDVINDIYQSEDVMEGHVFPYLRSIKE